ncbi:MAG TPA: hypothetical protein VHC68_02370 [Candidatus Paceibacterota bacterium]|nr:hypothetical protein [Candidatus Paceibacterota bacterium]
MRILFGIVFALAALALLIWVVSPGPARAPGEPGGQESGRHLPADAYPLYPGASWGGEEPTAEDGAVDYSVSATPFADITDIASVTEPFLSYYDRKLSAAGWSVDVAREAAGPGSELVPYLKGGQELIVSYSSVFKNNPPGEPEQCPCDTTLRLESVGG